MDRLVSSQGAWAADRATEAEFGYPPVLLMEEAGIRLQDRLEDLRRTGSLPTGLTVYLAGSGNNGGDALVMARQAFLRGDKAIAVVHVLPPRSPSCLWQAGVIQALGIPTYSWPTEESKEALRQAIVWIDGLWGTGLRESLRPEGQELLRSLRQIQAEGRQPTVAIDVPSGAWEGFRAQDPVLPATWTFAPGWLKEFCFFPEVREWVGRPAAIPLGFPRSADPVSHWIGAEDLPLLVPPVSQDRHKGSRGHVLVVGGAPGMTGALLLAARSAAATGAGLVTLGVDAPLVSLVAPQVPAFQTRDVTTVVSLLSRFQAVVVGPGWGRTEDRLRLLKDLWDSPLPLVLDADALWVWGQPKDWPARSAPVVVTPHPGEFRRIDTSDRPVVEAGLDLASQQKVTVVLKGAVTWILGPGGRRSVWDGRNPALGTGGSGDCLAGVVGALLGLGLEGFEAAQAAVALHGQAGQDLADAHGWFTADSLPEALARRAAACMAGLGPL